jgi:hypothetical protein
MNVSSDFVNVFCLFGVLGYAVGRGTAPEGHGFDSR